MISSDAPAGRFEDHRATVMQKTGTGSLSDLIHLEFAARRAAAGAIYAS
jgi:hypothetical protein